MPEQIDTLRNLAKNPRVVAIGEIGLDYYWAENPPRALQQEVLRRQLGLAEELQRKHRVVPAGPVTLTALLNSLQMGFRTLAIEKRSGEVWRLLSIVKEEFSRFGDILDKTQQRLRQASESIEDAARKSRTIEHKLKNVQSLEGTDEPPALDAVGEEDI